MTRADVLNSNQITYQRSSDKSDLLNPNLTHDNLSLGILRSVTQFRIPVVVTAVRTDHGPDPAGSVHGHGEGWALDFAPMNDDDAQELLNVLCHHTPTCTKVGLGGAYADLVEWPADGSNVLEINGTVVFRDNSSLHFHAQSA